MSLLLDALQRASKDKEKAAAAAVASASAAPLPESLPPESANSLEFHPGDFSTRSAAFPTLAIEPVDPSQAQHAPTLTLSRAPEMALVSSEPKLAEVGEESLAGTGPTASLPEPQPVPPPPDAPRWSMASNTTEPQRANIPSEPAAPLPASDSTTVAGQASPARVAKDIRRAYAKDAPFKRKHNRRVLVLGGVALALLLAMGSFLMGVWGDPAALVGLGGTSSLTPVGSPQQVPPPAPEQAQALPVQTPALAVDAVPTRSELAPVPGKGRESQAPLRSTAKTAGAPVAVVAAPRSLAGNEVVLRDSAVSLPDFEPKTRGPSALETAYMALTEGRLDDAVQSYELALRSNSEERDALLGLAYIALQKGQQEEAQSYYRRVLRQDPANATAGAALLALESSGNAALASGKARELASRQPDSAAAMAVAGNALVKEGQLAEAAPWFARAQALEPANPVHAYNHAVALDRLGQFAAAKTQYEKVLQLSGRGAKMGSRPFSVETVRLRIEQLQHALEAPLDSRP